jgi:hypothetical protein
MMELRIFSYVLLARKSHALHLLATQLEDPRYVGMLDTFTID